jgi:catechol 2,3-dioxygenase-like lactoylglutathione lyase family enzyme
VINHIALAVKDLERTHDFYTKAMGFKLVKVVKGLAPSGDGWGRHVFYDSGGGVLFAVWELHIDSVGDDAWGSGMSTGHGLPWWVNHIAFEAASAEDLQEKLERWLDYGIKVRELDHDFIHSIYTFDPDGTLVEWAVKQRSLDEHDAEEAERLLRDDSVPEAEKGWEPKIHLPANPRPWGKDLVAEREPAFPT